MEPRKIPHDLDAEMSVLGCCMFSADAVDDVQSAGLSEKDFYAWGNQKIFSRILEMVHAGEAVDAVMLASRMQTAGELDEVGGSAYLGRIMETVPHSAHAVHYAEIVMKLARRRNMIEAAQEAIEAAYTPRETEDILAEAETRLHAILERDVSGDTVGIRESLEALVAGLNRSDPPGVPMGWSDVNKLYQLQPGHLIYVAARPSMGKTGLAANLLINVARTGRRCLMFSLEMSTIEITGRLLSAWSQVSGLKINRMEQFDYGEQEDLLQAASGLADLPIDIDDDPDTTVSKIAAKSRLWKRRHGLDLVVVDYLQLIEPEDRRINREQQVSVISRTLKKLASQLEIPVVCLAQLNRQSEGRADKRPQLSDLRESGSLEQDANLVLLIHRPEVYDPNTRPGEADLIFAKNRSGKTGTVAVQFEQSTVTFRDLAHQISNYGYNEFS